LTPAAGVAKGKRSAEGQAEGTGGKPKRGKGKK